MDIDRSDHIKDFCILMAHIIGSLMAITGVIILAGGNNADEEPTLIAGLLLLAPGILSVLYCLIYGLCKTIQRYYRGDTMWRLERENADMIIAINYHTHPIP